MFALFSFLAGLVVFVTSIMLTVALRKVSESIERKLNSMCLCIALALWIFSLYLELSEFHSFYLFLKEYEDKILPWLWSFAVFTILRSLAWLFFSIVNDLIFAYNIFICLFWIVLIILSVWGWLVVYSLYIELRDLSKLEDLAHLRVIWRHYTNSWE